MVCASGNREEPMSKNQVMQIKEYIDEATGEMISFTDGDQRELDLLESQVAAGYFQIAVALKTIRDRKLYLLRGNNSMKEYVENHFHQSYRTAQRYLQIADSFANSKNRDELQQLPFSKLLELSQSEYAVSALNDESEISDGFVQFNNGEKESLSEFIDRIRQETLSTVESPDDIKTKLKRKTEDLKNKKLILERMEQQIEEREAKIAELENAVNNLSNGTIDPSTIVVASTKKQIIDLIANSEALTLKSLNQIDSLNQDLFDAEMCGRFSIAIGGIEATLQSIKSRWSAIVYAQGVEA